MPNPKDNLTERYVHSFFGVHGCQEDSYTQKLRARIESLKEELRLYREAKDIKRARQKMVWLESQHDRLEKRLALADTEIAELQQERDEAIGLLFALVRATEGD